MLEELVELHSNFKSYSRIVVNEVLDLYHDDVLSVLRAEDVSELDFLVVRNNLKFLLKNGYNHNEEDPYDDDEMLSIIGYIILLI